MSNTHEAVPLNVWPLDGPDVRRALVEHVIRAYSPEAGVVVDLLPVGLESVAAAWRWGRRAAALHVGDSTDAIAESVDLVLALPDRLSRSHSCRMGASEARGLAERSRSLLRPGAFLAVGVVPRSERDDVSRVVAAVTEVGLLYFQHIVALDRARLASCGERVTVEGHINVLAFRRAA